MFYEFPIIKNIGDVLPHIEGREEFRVMEKEGYIVINYIVAFDDTFKWDDNDPIGSSVRRECRGISFNHEGEVICRKYHKFFNVGEKDETQLNKINLYEPHIVLQKLDGSLISCQPSAYGFRLVSKSGITDVAMNAEVFIADKPNYSTFIRKCIQKGFSPLFEWCSNKNRIVISYETDQLILTGIRNIVTGDYVNYKQMKPYAEAYNIPVVKAIAGNETDITKIVEHIRKWEGSEGVVIRFDSGQMVKIKADDYVLRHKSKDAISQEKNVVQVVVEDAVDDMIPLLTPEDAGRLQAFSIAFWASLEDVATDLHDQYAALEKGESQKDFAVVVQKEIPKHLQHFMFGIHRGIPVRDLLVSSISKSLNTQTKVNEARWMWGNLNWHNS